MIQHLIFSSDKVAFSGTSQHEAGQSEGSFLYISLTRAPTSSPRSPQTDKTTCSFILYWQLERKQILCPSLHQGLVNWLVSQIWWTTCFCESSFTGTQPPRLFTRYLQLLLCCYGTVKQSQQTTEPKIFTTCLFTEKVCQHCVQGKHILNMWRDGEFLQMKVFKLTSHHQMSWCIPMSGSSLRTAEEPNHPQTSS